ncbi:hypothetical protein [Paenibacillus sp. FSL H7-0331]|uniref:hypothetical protein n=1 Tax=Paenibacillus sp. FSL H7-0331 TaxID=1920421 RepID=UPI00096DDDCF|nr:hypothetical protein [Paenibacillus sp. FSL H7-0331]OMF13173.1 hypothetical protein BK127_21520 [Paenibacillus sp. FSL H7-0331]
MKHYTGEQWMTYVEQGLNDDDNQQMELHLITCDSCMELYMQSLEGVVGSYPTLSDEAALADRVMLAIEAAGPISPSSTASRLAPLEEAGFGSQKLRNPITWMRAPLFHYAVAAVITLVLMSSGIFQSIVDHPVGIDRASNGDAQSEATQEPVSVSKKLMDKTIVVLDSIQPKQEKGGNR